MTCPRCKSNETTKAGFNHDKQRYKCKECKYQFTQVEDKNAHNRATALYLYACGLSMRCIARLFSVAPSTVLYWIRNFAIKTYEKPTPKCDVVIELDEMWHFINSKKTNVGYGKHTAEPPVNSLIGSVAVEVLKR